MKPTRHLHREMYRTCVHEAGHAVMAIDAESPVHGMGLGDPRKHPVFADEERLSFEDNPSGYKIDVELIVGYCIHGDSRKGYSQDDSDATKTKELNRKLGGIAAEIVILGSFTGCGEDIEMAHNLCRFYGIPFDPQYSESIRAARRKKYVIEKLAKLLLDKRCLNADEIISCIISVHKTATV